MWRCEKNVTTINLLLAKFQIRKEIHVSKGHRKMDKKRQVGISGNLNDIQITI